MNKKFIYFAILAVIAGLVLKTAYTRYQGQTETKTTPSNVISSTESTTTLNSEIATTTEASRELSSKITTTPTPVVPTQKTILSKTASRISSSIALVVDKVGSSLSQNYAIAALYRQADSSIAPSSYVNNQPSSPSVNKPLPPKDFAGEKYIVIDNNIVSTDNKVIYNIPSQVIDNINSTSTGWTNTIINVVPVGTTPPIVGAIPVENLPGKYYLSHNSFGDLSKCEFSNKIFILDTITNETTLIYEENNTTLSKDDPRACYSEIFLLATDKEKLVLKYHTIGTNTSCDSAWSEPEKTFFIDVTKLLTEGMKKYLIPENLSSTAEQEESACRAQI